MSKFKEIDLQGLKKYSVRDRPSKVSIRDFANPQECVGTKFPNFPAAGDFQELIDKCVLAVHNKKPIFAALGGHVVKCGLSPYLIDLLKTGVISGISGNGSVVIHDFEIASFGKTSEDVASALEDGSFGMATETCDGINRIITRAAAEKLGYGEAVGKYLCEVDAPHNHLSLLASAYEMNIPFTVHVALGTDINHQHETADGAAIGACSLRDFRIFCHNLISLNEGGVFLNFGSAVVMPEVFLKAVTVVRNLGFPLRNFSTAVFDMNMHYRPRVNIVQRPTLSGGKGYYFIGHHEIMIPLFHQTLKSRLQNA